MFSVQKLVKGLLINASQNATPQRPVRQNGRFNSARSSNCVKNPTQMQKIDTTCKSANCKIRINRTTIIDDDHDDDDDDDIDNDTCSQTSLSVSSCSSSSSSFSDDTTSRFPTIDRSRIKKKKTLKVVQSSI